jgi:hypothetical protein
MTVTQATDTAPERETQPLPRFGQPSSYSLTVPELAAHIRELRRNGWQSWEVRARFDFGTVTHAA